MDGIALKDLRIQSGLTQSEMADRIGIKLRQYQSFENGAANIKPIHVAAINLASLRLAIDQGKPDLATDDARDITTRFIAISTPRFEVVPHQGPRL